MSAFIVRRPYRPATLVTVVAEVALLMENTNWRPGSELTWNHASMSCSSAMSRFLTESLGLCIAVSSAHSYGWNPFKAILDIDRLSKTSPLYVSTGSRPDFAAQTRNGWHGIEARGRSDPGPATSRRPIAVQKNKLRGMHEWSTKVGGHPLVRALPSWSMTWAWITERQSAVDHFDPGEPLLLEDSHEQDIWREMSKRAVELAEVDDSDVRRVDALHRQVSVISRLIRNSSEREGSTWLTVACWTDRLTISEVDEWRGEPNATQKQDKASQAQLAGVIQATVGSFLATAITSTEPVVDDLGPLLNAIAVDAIEAGGMVDL